MTNKLRLLLLAPLAVAAACSNGGDAGPPQMPPPAVSVVTLESAPVALRRELPGRTTAYRFAEIRPQVTGIIEERLFEEGAKVKAGQPLYRIENSTYAADVASAEAALARAEAAVESARLASERADALAKIDAISQQEHENATAAYLLAQADVKVAAAAVSRAKVVLGYTRIPAPIDGIVGSSAVTPGALVTANQSEPLTTVQQLDPIYVDITQSSSEQLRLRREIAAGNVRLTEQVPVKILLEDGTEYSRQGLLTFSAVRVDPSTGSFAMRAVVPNPDGVLMPGMYVRAVIAAAIVQDAVLVPMQAVARDPKGNASVMVVNDAGVAEPRAIQVSRAIGNQWLVDGGLVAGDRVIVEGLQRVQPGAPVQATELAPTPVQGG